MKRLVTLLLVLVLQAAQPAFPATPLAGTRPESDAAMAEAPRNWPQFRGPRGLPVSDHPGLPSSWSTTENMDWVAEIPGTGWSSPIVWNGRVFLTTAVSEATMKQPSLGVDFSNEYVAELQREGLTEDELEKRLYARDIEMPDEVSLSYRVLCLDLETGDVKWSREIYSGPPPVGRHRKNSFASETPVTDGKAVYVYISHLGLWALDFAGKELWRTPLEAHQVYLDFGGGTSPALAKDRLFVLNDNEESSFLAAFDAVTGKQLWRKERGGMGVQGRSSGWATPYVWENSVRTEVVTLGPGYAISYGLDGEELWRMPIATVMTIASPFAWDGVLYLSAGGGGEPLRPVVAMLPGASGEIPLPEQGVENDALLWFDGQAGGTYLPTPLVYRGRLWVLTDKGILSVYDAKTGEQLYRSRIHREARNFTASPWAYNGTVFMINEEGVTFAIAAEGDELELREINRLDGFVLATPAISGDRLLIRTQGNLYALRASEPASGDE